MGERRNHAGGALLGLAGLCWVSTVIADGTQTLGWDSLPSVLLLIAGGLCLLGSLWAFGALNPFLCWWSWSSSGTAPPVAAERTAQEVGAELAADLPQGTARRRTSTDDVQADRVELLREQHRRGRSLQKRLVWTAGTARTPERARDIEDEARYAACKWAEGAWRVIAEHFPGYEREFFGEGHPALGATGFAMACQQAMERVSTSADSYLDGKLAFIEGLLRRYDG